MRSRSRRCSARSTTRRAASFIPREGEIVVELEQEGGALHGRVVLPPALTGTLRLPAGARPLVAGETRF